MSVATERRGTEEADLELARETVADGGALLVHDRRGEEAGLIVAAESIDADLLGLGGAASLGPLTAVLDREALVRKGLQPRDGAAGAEVLTTVDAAAAAHGFTAADRALTCRTLADPLTDPHALRAPGSVTVASVCRLPGSAEQERRRAAYDFAVAAGRSTGVVLAPVLGPAGALARGPEWRAFAARHALPSIGWAALERAAGTASCALPTPWGVFRVEAEMEDDEAVILTLSHGQPAASRGIRVAVLEGCGLGDAIPMACGCRAQLEATMSEIAGAGAGVLIYRKPAQLSLEAIGRGTRSAPGSWATAAVDRARKRLGLREPRVTGVRQRRGAGRPCRGRFPAPEGVCAK